MKKVLKQSCILMASVLLVSSLGSCGTKNTSTQNDTVNISIGGWPSKEATVTSAKYEDWLNRYNELYPNVKVEKDEWAYSYDTFLAKAASNMLPSIYTTFFTEIKKIKDAGYAADITNQMQKYGYVDNLNEDLLSLCESNDQYFTLPKSAYTLSLVANKEFFKEIGQVDSEGYAILPQTIDELTETAIKIKEKTGKTAFVIPTMNKVGGWIFSNIAWQFGVNFIKSENDKYVANFNTPEMEDALQWLYDMKWKYKVMEDNAFIDDGEVVKLFGGSNAAMYVGQPTDGKIKTMIHGYGFNKDNLVLGQVPGGKGGRFALLGGDVWVLNNNLDENQKNAVFDWLNLIGFGTTIDENSAKSIEQNYEDLNKLGSVVGYKGLEIWKSGPISEAYENARKKYCNVDVNNFKEYSDFTNVTLRKEEPVHCQDLYDVLDGMIQEVLSNKNVDIKTLIKTGNDNFQRNFLNE